MKKYNFILFIIIFMYVYRYICIYFGYKRNYFEVIYLMLNVVYFLVFGCLGLVINLFISNLTNLFINRFIIFSDFNG